MADDGPRIIDFGIAQAAGATALTTPGTVIGTYSFMSPEQIRADSVTPESDVFSLGCVLAYAATGRAPFDASHGAAIMYRVLNEQPDLGDLPASVLRDTLAACLAKDPERRPLPSDLLARFAVGSPTRLPRGAGETRVAGTPGGRGPGRDPEPSRRRGGSRSGCSGRGGSRRVHPGRRVARGASPGRTSRKHHNQTGMRTRPRTAS